MSITERREPDVAEALAWAERMAAEVETSPSRYLDSEGERAFRARLFRGLGKELQ